MISMVNYMKQVCNYCQKFTWIDGTQLIIVNKQLVMSKYNFSHPWISFRVYGEKKCAHWDSHMIEWKSYGCYQVVELRILGVVIKEWRWHFVTSRTLVKSRMLHLSKTQEANV